MLDTLWNLFIGFLRAGNLSFGGGGAIIPLIKTESVDQYHWVTLHQFSDAVAIDSSLPGPIATNLAGYVGFQAASWLGALVSILAVIAPTILILIWAQKYVERYAQTKPVKAVLAGVRPVISALILYVAFDMACNPSMGALLIKTPLDAATLAIAAAAALAIFKFKVHPGFVIIGSLLVGMVIW
ncbi:MAG: chromate transporter [Peptococcaceae bacterium]|jgi:chromate transporter|nr:chromate transporter [Peptococcaceae bacterium]